MNRADVYRVIDGERDYQDSLKSTSENVDGRHTYAEYAMYMESYARKMVDLASTTWGPDAKVRTLDMMRKVVALGVACMEENGAVERFGTEVILGFEPSVADNLPFLEGRPSVVYPGLDEINGRLA